MLDWHLRDLADEAAYARVLSRLNDVFAGQCVEFEMELRYRADVGHRFVHAAYPSQHGPDSKIQVLACVVEGITGRKKAEHERFRHQREFATLVENTLDVIARLDRELRCMYVGRTVTEAFDVASAVMISKALVASPLVTEVMHPLGDAAHHAFAVGVERTLALHLSVLDRRLRIAYCNVRVIPEANRNGAVGSALLIIYDVTERTEAECKRDALLLREQATCAQTEVVARAHD